MRAFDRDLIRGGHYGQRHEYRTRRPNTWLLRPTPQVKILLANPEPSTHGAFGDLVPDVRYVCFQVMSGPDAPGKVRSSH